MVGKLMQKTTRISMLNHRQATKNVPGVGVLAFCAFSFSLANASRGCTTGVTGSIFFNGACLLPGTMSFVVLSGELYIPNTSANASLVLMVTVGSAPPIMLLRALYRDDFWPSSLKSTTASDDDEDDEEFEKRSDGGGGAHFFPSKPIDLARASCMLYSIPSSVHNKPMLNRSFSGRFPGAGGASISAYRCAAVDIKAPVGMGPDEDAELDGGFDELADRELLVAALLREGPALDEVVEGGLEADADVADDDGPLL
jgi:hypothetical protein